MNFEAIEAVRDNPYFIRDNIDRDYKLEMELFTGIKARLKHNTAAFKLIENNMFTIFNNEYNELRKMIIGGSKIDKDFKWLVYKLMMYNICRLCQEAGYKNVDWRIIITVYKTVLKPDQIKRIDEWLELYNATN